MKHYLIGFAAGCVPVGLYFLNLLWLLPIIGIIAGAFIGKRLAKSYLNSLKKP